MPALGIVLFCKETVLKTGNWIFKNNSLQGSGGPRELDFMQQKH